MSLWTNGVGGVTQLLSRDGDAGELLEDPTVRHTLRSGPGVKNGEVVSKMARRRGSDAGQSRRSRVRSCR